MMQRNRGAQAPGVVRLHGRVYKTVALRVHEFRQQHSIEEGWAIITEVLSADERSVMVQAEIRDPAGRVVATGFAQEQRSSGGVNATSALENAETSAIGRALATAGFGQAHEFALPERPTARAEARGQAPGGAQRGAFEGRQRPPQRASAQQGNTRQATAQQGSPPQAAQQQAAHQAQRQQQRPQRPSSERPGQQRAQQRPPQQRPGNRRPAPPRPRGPGSQAGPSRGAPQQAPQQRNPRSQQRAGRGAPQGPPVRPGRPAVAADAQPARPPQESSVELGASTGQPEPTLSQALAVVSSISQRPRSALRSVPAQRRPPHKRRA